MVTTISTQRAAAVLQKAVSGLFPEDLEASIQESVLHEDHFFDGILEVVHPILKYLATNRTITIKIDTDGNGLRHRKFNLELDEPVVCVTSTLSQEWESGRDDCDFHGNTLLITRKGEWQIISYSGLYSKLTDSIEDWQQEYVHWISRYAICMFGESKILCGLADVLTEEARVREKRLDSVRCCQEVIKAAIEAALAPENPPAE